MVVGSLNMDFVARTKQLPARGETVLGYGFEMIPGGKGANQALWRPQNWARLPSR